MKNSLNITKTYSRIVWSALAAFGLTALSTQAAIANWDNNGGVGDFEWGTATNWDPAAPAATDDVTIANGDTVNITGNILASGLDISLSGGSDLTYTGIGGAFQFNLNSATIALGAGSDLSYNGDLRMWNSASLEFDDGALLGSALDTEFRGSNAGLQFNLGATGFTTLTPDQLKFWTGNDLSDVNITVDFADYTIGGSTITLIDWTSGPGSQALLDAATQNFNNASGYSNIALTWNDTNKAIELSFTVPTPEPSSLALLAVGLGTMFGMRKQIRKQC